MAAFAMLSWRSIPALLYLCLLLVLSMNASHQARAAPLLSSNLSKSRTPNRSLSLAQPSLDWRSARSAPVKRKLQDRNISIESLSDNEVPLRRAAAAKEARELGITMSEVGQDIRVVQERNLKEEETFQERRRSERERMRERWRIQQASRRGKQW